MTDNIEIETFPKCKKCGQSHPVWRDDEFHKTWRDTAGLVYEAAIRTGRDGKARRVEFEGEGVTFTFHGYERLQDGPGPRTCSVTVRMDFAGEDDAG